MKYTLTLLMFFINLNNLLFSQEFRDQLSNDKISVVEIYSDKGDLVGTTNLDGSLSVDLKNKILAANTKYLIFVNSFFENKVVDINDFKENAIFKMNPLINELKEVRISSRKDKENYLVIKTYIRSFQVNNERIQYFMDGIVEYYISLKTNKIKLKFLSNRSFENTAINQLKEKGLANVFFQVTGAPMINNLITYNQLNENFNFQKAEDEIKINTKNDNDLKGIFSANGNKGNLSLELISSDKPKVMKGLGVENILTNYNVKSQFTTQKFEEIDFKTLSYFKEIRNYEIKAKKDNKFQKVIATHEVFVLDYKFSETIEANKLDNNYSFKKHSDYSERYWENVDNVLFQPLPQSIELFIKENLTELK
nr:hypothetical protein [uncultured Flavobacterium sp.]